MRDNIGNTINIGDYVFCLECKLKHTIQNVVKSLSEKICLMDISKNRFGQSEYRKKYAEVISLTAIGKETLTIK